MDVSLINPFVRATERVFMLMVGTPVRPESPRVFARVPGGENIVNAVILLDDGNTGAALLRFPPSVVFPIAKPIVGSRLSLQAAHDAMGELANMVVGNAKRDLSQKLIRISVPVISVGDVELKIITAMTPWIDVPLCTSLGTFFLTISVKDTAAAAPQPRPAYEMQCDSAGHCVAAPHVDS